MKKMFLYFSVALVLYSKCAFSQYGSFNDKIVQGQKDNNKKKKFKIAETYTKFVQFKSDTIPMMRVPIDKIKSPSEQFIIKVQNNLDDINKKLNQNLPASEIIENTNSVSLTLIKSYDSEWYTEYYKSELKIYDRCDKELKNQRSAKAKAVQDSIREENRIITTAKKEQENKEKEIKKTIQSESLQTEKLKDDPYVLLKGSLDGIKNRVLTVFCGIDVNFANGRLSWYLQDKLSLSSKDVKYLDNKFIEKYVPRVSTENEFLKVTYFLKDTDKKPYYKTDNGKCSVITKCEITGTADLILNLFLDYWPQKISLGGYKQGEIAHFQFMGDRVSLYGVSPPNIYKILITADNISMDYYETFKIK